MWNMISPPATPTVCIGQKSENVQSRNVTLSMPSASQVFDIICYVAYQSAAKFTLPVDQPSKNGLQMWHQAIMETEIET